MSENVRKCTKIELLFTKEKTLETLIFQGFSAYETRGIRTPDNLIKSQLKTPHLCGLATPIPPPSRHQTDVRIKNSWSKMQKRAHTPIV